MTTTENMALVLATVSETLGPEWAELLNAMFERVDLHDHSAGNGAKVTPAGLDLNAAVDLQGNDLEAAGSLGLSSLDAADADLTGSIQRIGSNLWWVNAAGVAVQLTSGNAVASTGSGELSVTTPGAYPYSVTTGDAQKVILVDSTAARTLNLPAASNAMYVIVKDSAGSAATNNISVVPDGSDTIDGSAATYTIDANRASVGLISDGVSAWHVV